MSSFRLDFISSTNFSKSTSVPVGSIFTIKSNLAIFYGPEKPHDSHLYGAAASLQLPHLQINSSGHSGQMNFTLLSPGMMCLLQPLHTGNEIFGEFPSKSNIPFEDIIKSPLLGIYTFLEILRFILNKSLNFSSNQCLHCIEGTFHS